MPWYYAGPETKPVGPLSLEELHARRHGGAITPETYVIEHTGAASENPAWKRYREVFSATTSLPTMPPIPGTMAAPHLTPRPATQPHPLFPSAAPVPTASSPFSSAPRPDPYYAPRKKNIWCVVGFFLGLGGLVFSFACGLGLLLALPALVLCVFGMIQVSKHKDQSGAGMAISGFILAFIAVLIAFSIILIWAVPVIKAHEPTVTEQTPNDSQ